MTMKTTMIILLMSLGVMMFVTSGPVLAVDIIDDGVCENAVGTPSICEDIDSQNESESDNVLIGPDGIITRLSRYLVWISGALGAILIIISGLMFIFSSGNPDSAGRARRTAMYAVVGVAVAVVGQVIVTYVLEQL